jgi:hypothetical protein
MLMKGVGSATSAWKFGLPGVSVTEPALCFDTCLAAHVDTAIDHGIKVGLVELRVPRKAGV